MKHKDRSNEQLLHDHYEIGKFAERARGILLKAGFAHTSGVIEDIQKIIDITAMTKREYESWLNFYQNPNLRKVHRYEERQVSSSVACRAN